MPTSAFLAPDTQEALLDLSPTLKGRDRLRYRDVYPLTVVTSWKRQREMWTRLAAKAADVIAAPDDVTH